MKRLTNESTSRVYGVVSVGSVTIEGVLVKLFNRTLREETQLGSAFTDVCGRYQIEYDREPLLQSGRKTIDLFIRAEHPDGEYEPFESPVIYRAKTLEAVAVQLRPVERAGTEWEQIEAALAPLLAEADTADLTDEQAEYAAGASGISPHRMLDWRSAHRLSRESGGVPASVYYGLLRTGLPAHTDGLATLPSGEWERALEQAAQHRYIPDLDEGTRVKSIARLEELGERRRETTLAAADRTLQPEPESDEPTLRRLALARFLSERPAVPAAFRTEAKQSHTEAAPLREEAGPEHEAFEDWLRKERSMFPHFDADDALEEAKRTGILRNPARERLARFLAQSADFDIEKTVIDEYLAAGRNEERAGLAAEEVLTEQDVASLKAIQRVYQITPQPEHVAELMGGGLDSAMSVAGVGEEAFVERFGDALGGGEEAQRVYAQAEQIYATATQLYTSVYQAMNDVNPAALGGSALAESLRKAFPDWAALFGRIDMCDCAQCRSVYSAAAYYVDLLQFLNPKTLPTGVYIRPIDVLRRHRPDLEHIKLTCENTNVEIPYIDLVNEVLESYIARGVPTVNNTSPDSAAEDLGVQREYSDSFPESISIQAAAAVKDYLYPFGLPYDKYLQEIRAYLGLLGTDLHTLMSVFPERHGESALAAEYLGLSRRDREIWEEQTGRSLQSLYGYDFESISSQGLLGEYYPNFDLSGDPLFARVEPQVAFDWDDGPPESTLPAKFSVRLSGSIVLSASQQKVLQIDCTGGYRLWLNGQLLFDRWNETNPEVGVTNPIPMQAGVPYAIKLELRCGGTTGEWGYLHWADPGNYRLVPQEDLRCSLPWSQYLCHVPEFLARTKLSYESLLELLSTRYLNPNPAVPSVTVAAQGDPCDLNTMWLRGAENDSRTPLRRVHRFVRLARRLGVGFSDLDRALAAFGSEPETFLIKYADLRRIRRELGERLATEAELLVLWSPLDTHGPDCLYAKLFQNKAIANPPDPDLSLLDDRLEIRGHALPLSSKKAQILAVLRLKDSDWPALLESAGLIEAGALLTLANLSLLYRCALLGRLLAASMAELAALLRFTGIAPFVSPAETLRLIRARRLIEAEGLRIGELNYWFRNRELPNQGRAPTDVTVAKLASALRAGYDRIDEAAASQQDGQETAGSLRRMFAIQTLADKLGLTETLLAELIEKTLHSANARTPGAYLIDDFLGTDQGLLLPAYRRLDKAAAIVRSLEWEEEDIAYVRANGTDFGGFSLDRVVSGAAESEAESGASFAQWRLLTRYSYAKRLLLPDAPGLPELLAGAKRAGASRDSVLQAWSEAAGWDAGDLLALGGPAGWNLQPSDLANPDRIPAIRDAVLLSERIRVPAVKWLSWYLPQPNAQLAFEVKNAAKSQHSEQSWRQYAAAVENGLREQWRDALVQFVLEMPVIRLEGIRDGNQLFEFFLIDVGMNAEMKTSRIKQAVSSVQLFVQRCLLNLEPNVPPRLINAKQWEWVKNYRTWEANRKIFLYPENWAEPDLRDDKTPLFKELETEILQKDINDANVADAFGSYVSKMDDIARLDVRAMSLYNGEVHLFARTYAKPHAYYHRIRKGRKWTPWIKIEADIQGDHVVPVLHQSSLYLFWGVVEKKADQKDNVPQSESPASTQEQLVMRLAWSEYQSGRWTAKRQSEEHLLLQLLLRTDDEQASKALYRLYPTAVYENGKKNLGLVVLRDYRLAFSTGLRYESFEWGQFIFDDTRKGVVVKPYAGGNRVLVFGPSGVDMDGLFLKSGATHPLIIPRIQGELPYGEPIMALNQAQGPFRLVMPYNAFAHFAFDEGRKDLAFVQQDRHRTYYAEQSRVYSGPVLNYENLYHPLTRAFVQTLNERGVEGLLSLETQQLTNETDGDTVFNRLYRPTSAASGFNVKEVVDFVDQGAYAVYNWELFFHIPMLLADRLTKEKRYAEALKWYHAVFNPTVDSALEGAAKYWRFLPFHTNVQENRIWKLLTALADPNGDPAVKEMLQLQIAEWRENPFEPHRIARMRISSYQKAVVMKYIDTLVAWGDDLFARDTMESINEATQLYVMAASLLGPRPERIPELTEAPAKTYAELLQGGLDDFSNALVDIQNRFPYVKVQPAVGPSGAPIGTGVGRSLYFGIPQNDMLLAYWDTVEDRLQKIRNGLNLQGVARSLSLFEAPLDPAAVVIAASAGGGTGSVLNDLSQPLGHYRFAAVMPLAQELCAEVKSLGAALLAALEKKDAEELGGLRARHESSMNRLIRQVKLYQIEEANKVLEGLQKSRAVAEYRFNHYKRILDAGLNAFELGQLILLGGSAVLQGVAGVAELASSIGHAVPDMNVGVAGWASTPVVTARYGGSNVGGAASAFGKAMGTLASILGTASSMSGIMGEQKRRSDEWLLQQETASRELQQIDAQIAAAGIRLSIAERELANHDRQIEQAEEVERFLLEKYTSRELYQWMSNQLTTLYFQTYQMAYNTAKRAEMAYRFERGLAGSGYIVFGYWDSLRKGLLAGERLHLDLKRLELAYQEQNARDYELTKTVSLVQLDPIALIALKETGICTIKLPEELFDMDHPGHYMRRLKTVSLSIPCVAGPHTGVHGRLTLMSSRIRAAKTPAAPYKIQPDDTRFLYDFAAVQSIAFSHAQNDAGLFELSFRDERYLPFEGAGAVSEWRLELPKETNAFDFDTIGDVLLHINYTAREGGDTLRQAAYASAVFEPAGPQGTTSAPIPQLPPQPSLQRLISVRHEYSAEWHRFLHPLPADTVQTLSLKLDGARFPYRYRGRSLTVGGVKCYLKLKDGTVYPATGPQLVLTLAIPVTGTVLSMPLVSNEAVLHGLPSASFDVSGEGQGFGDWVLSAAESSVFGLPDALKTSVDGHDRLNPAVIEDLLVLLDYSVG